MVIIKSRSLKEDDPTAPSSTGYLVTNLPIIRPNLDAALGILSRRYWVCPNSHGLTGVCTRPGSEFTAVLLTNAYSQIQLHAGEFYPVI